MTETQRVRALVLGESKERNVKVQEVQGGLYAEGMIIYVDNPKEF